VRLRFGAKLDARINGIESSLPRPGHVAGPDVLAVAHRHAHDLCGVGPTLGYIGTAKVARSIEQVLFAAVKADRTLSDDDVACLREGIPLLRSTAAAEMHTAGRP
jgi:hypothetical protein